MRYALLEQNTRRMHGMQRLRVLAAGLKADVTFETTINYLKNIATSHACIQRPNGNVHASQKKACPVLAWKVKCAENCANIY
eukprot:593652-Pleurochrysis_carterae.AAC.3